MLLSWKNKLYTIVVNATKARKKRALVKKADRAYRIYKKLKQAYFSVHGTYEIGFVGSDKLGQAQLRWQMAEWHLAAVEGRAPIFYPYYVDDIQPEHLRRERTLSLVR